MMLSLDTAYRSFGGEVEASSTPTICRLPDSRRHQLSALARGPVAVGDRDDLPRLIDEGVPSVAAVIDDIVERFEDPVRQPILTHELPDIFLTVEFGRAPGQWQ